MIELKDTIDMMTSADYKDRLMAEYWQTKIRYDKLETMMIKYGAGTLGFEPTCSAELLDAQMRYMSDYIRCLRIRAEIEGIEL